MLKGITRIPPVDIATLPDDLRETLEEQTKLRNALKKMAIDAHGKPVEEGGDDNKKPSTSDKVTRTMKGEKEIVIDIAALKGKGYPLPVNINA